MTDKQKRVIEIEDKVARGEMSAAQVFTQMRRLIESKPLSIEKLSSGDINSIAYFWGEYRNFERWTGWEQALPRIRANHPELIAAYEAYRRSIKNMNRIIEELGAAHD